MSFVSELKRRNVFRAAAAYVAVSWLVIQVAETTFPAFGLSDAALRTLIVILAVGFIPAVALSWAFELTPEGLKRDRDLQPGSELSRRTNRLLDRGIVTVLALGLAYFALDKFVLDPARDEVKIEEAEQRGRTEALVESYGDQSIAVLPFTNMSADPEQAYFGDGMAEEVLNLLARIPELRVISRSSAFTYKDQNKKLTEIADELNVVHILEGSVRRSGNRIRVTAQLIEARSDTHLWSATWDRELEDIFAIQDEIAAEVVANLRLKLLGDAPKARRVDPEAYLLFMQAREILDKARHDDLQQAYDLLTEALRRDPQYAEALTGLAWLSYRCYVLSESGPGGPEYCANREPREWLDLTTEYGRQALAADPGNPTAHAYQAFGRVFHGDRDFQAVADQARFAIEAAPPVSDIVRSMSIVARAMKRPDLAVRLGEYGLARDPLCQQCMYQLARSYLEARRYAEALRVLDKFTLLRRGGDLSTGWAHLLNGDASAALKAFESRSVPEENPQYPYYLAGRAMALHSLGRAGEFNEALRTLESRFGNQSPAAVAELHAWVGDLDAASAWLELELDRPPPLAALAPIDYRSPFLQTVLALPRWQEFLRKYGLADDQLARIEFDFTLPGE